MTTSFIGKVFDNYRILENLGIGGMGVVFKAIHVKLEKLLALKMIAPGLAMNENFIKRFQTEAKALAKLEDPNIVRIYDLRSDNDQWFIVMEYVEGANLAELLKKNGAYQWEDAIPILKQILSAMGHAHASGIIHRDMKPNNVMITTDGVVKITDFGLAKDQTSMASTMTMTSGGTLYYMSPEHVRGLAYTDVRSDIYAVGMTFYEMLAGNVPFRKIDSDFDIRETIIRKDIAKPTSFNSTIPILLEKIIMKAIAKEPDKRYQTAEAMLHAVKEFETKANMAEIAENNLGKPKRKHKKMVRKHTGQKGDEKRRSLLPYYAAAVAITAILLFFLAYTNFSPDSEKIESKTVQPLLSISSTPPAIIFIDGDSLGRTPISTNVLQAGNHLIHLQSENYTPLDTNIQIQNEQDLNLDFVLQPTMVVQQPVPVPPAVEAAVSNTIAAAAYIAIASSPEAADILINGWYKGKTPLVIRDLEPGQYTISLKKDNHEQYQQSFQFNSGKNPDIMAILNPVGGDLTIATTPSTASVLIDGMEIRDDSRPLLLKNIAAGIHKIEIVHDGYQTVTKEINIEQDQSQQINATLVQLSGELNIKIRPWGSIYINDQLQKASTDRNFSIELPVQDYQIKIMHPTLGHWEKTIQLDSDHPTEITVNFNKKFPVLVGAVDENGNPLDGQIFIDDQDTGKATPQEITMRQGLHKLSVKKKGYTTRDGVLEILVDENFNKPLTFVLRKVN
jgi:serine/threonine protein kinase